MRKARAARVLYSIFFQPYFSMASMAQDSVGGHPLLERERILSLDMLRGFAVPGILVMNIQAFSQVFQAYLNPTAPGGGIQGPGYWVWLGSLYPFREMAPKHLLVVGILVLCFGLALSLASGSSMPFWPAQQVAAFERGVWQASARDTAVQIAGYRGGWLAQMPFRATESLLSETSGFLFLTLWRAGGLMLVGVALYQLGLLTLTASAHHSFMDTLRRRQGVTI